MSRKITLGELAKLAGVSPATASIVLNNHPLARRIPEQTKKRIISLAEEVHYHPNQLAKAMRTQSAGIIGFICGGIAEPFFAQLCSELTIQVEQSGYRLMAMLTEWNFQKELDALELLLSKTVDGVLMFSNAFSEDNKRTEPFRNNNLPLVMLSELPCPGCSSVQSDYTTGMQELFELLTASRYSRVAFLSHQRFPAKHEAYSSVVKKYGMEDISFLIQPGEDAMDRTLDNVLANLPEVLIVNSDHDSMIVIPKLIQRGIRVPEDLSVVSIDGTYISRLYNPSLAAISHDFPRLAHQALALLERKIGGEYAISTERIPTHLRLGKSLKLKDGLFSLSNH